MTKGFPLQNVTKRFLLDTRRQPKLSSIVIFVLFKITMRLVVIKQGISTRKFLRLNSISFDGFQICLSSV